MALEMLGTQARQGSDVCLGCPPQRQGLQTPAEGLNETHSGHRTGDRPSPPTHPYPAHAGNREQMEAGVAAGHRQTQQVQS